MPSQHSDLRAALYLADDIEASEKELLDSGWGGYPWEHLGDASRDIHKLIRGLREAAGLVEQFDAAIEALWCYREEIGHIQRGGITGPQTCIRGCPGCRADRVLRNAHRAPTDTTILHEASTPATKPEGE